MFKLKRFKKLCATIVIFFLLLFSSSAIASTLTLSSGQEFDLTARQVELLKEQKGIYFFHYSPKKIISGKLTYDVFFELPEEFGGGFIIAQPEKMAAALKAVATDKSTELEDAYEKSRLSSVRARKADSWFATEFFLSTGYRVDDLDFNIAGDINGNNPNIISELKWRELKSFQLKIANKTVLQQLFLLRSSLAYGWIFDGRNQDSDYWGNNRNCEWSRSNNNTDDGNVLDASFGVGWQFTFGRSDFVMTPVIGYSYHEQNLTMTDGCQTIATPLCTPELGPFPDLDSTFETEWKGPWIGLDFTFRSNEKTDLSPIIETCISVEYHWADYYAEADWNLRTDFAHPKSFEHKADGNGIVLSAVLKFLLDYQWTLNIKLDYQNWSTDSGIIRAFLSDGAIADQRLNDVNWESYAMMAGIEYCF
ncbi:MAG: hypothetical protein LWW98_05200 [Deltaproteobacteria bacterium]|nr:hypothetical protein [Deltaproteobacteria bacterium]